jgi:hypothetical protein
LANRSDDHWKRRKFFSVEPWKPGRGFWLFSGQLPTDSEWDISNPMLVFSNPPQAGPGGNYLTAKPGSPVAPLSNTQSMVYFPPGVYDLGQTPFVLGITQDGVAQGAFLAGGAYVKGAFQIASNAKGTKIAGRGILSGEEIPRNPCEASQTCSMIDGTKIAGQALIQGITIVNSPLRNVNLKGVENALRGIRIISWYANSWSFQATFSPTTTNWAPSAI